MDDIPMIGLSWDVCMRSDEWFNEISWDQFGLFGRSAIYKHKRFLKSGRELSWDNRLSSGKNDNAGTVAPKSYLRAAKKI